VLGGRDPSEWLVEILRAHLDALQARGLEASAKNSSDV